MKTSRALALLATLVLSTSAFADGDTGEGLRRPGFLLDRSSHPRPLLLAVHGIVPLGYFGRGGFPVGVGATFYLPLVKDGFIPPVNDEFGIDFGVDAFFFPGYRNGFALFVPVTVLWTFHFTDTFAAYAKVGAALRFWPGFDQPVFPDFVSALGLNWFFARSVGLRVELGYPGAKVGLLFAF